MNLAVHNLRQAFDQVRALDDVCFEIAGDHASLVLIGPSGGGKSTLLRVLGGLQQPQSGVVRWDGAAMAFDQAALLRWRRSNGFVFQQFNLFPHLTAGQNLALPLTQVHGLVRHEADQRAQRWLERFGVGHLMGRRPAAMSGGQQQRVALARAMAHEPRRLFLDEPTSALDPAMTVEVLEAVLQVAHEGQQIVVATHEMGFAHALGGDVLMLTAGKVVGCASANDFFADPKSPEARTFLRHLTRFQVPTLSPQPSVPN
jgi:polar amino acid transport system ATP-binding protein